MKQTFRPTPLAQQIVDALKSVLEGTVMLIDEHEKAVHTSLSEQRWGSFRDAHLHRNPQRCHAEVAVNDRWTLLVLARNGRLLHPDAASLVSWAAVKLARQLARLPRDRGFPYPPAGGNGGPSGSAEIGIPVWWARRIRR